MSCNDSHKKEVVTASKKAAESAKKDEKKQEVAECSTLDNFNKQCLVGMWKIKSAKILIEGEKDINFTAKNVSDVEMLEINENKISGYMLVVNDTLQIESNPLKFNSNDYTFEKNDNKIKIKFDKEIKINISTNTSGGTRDKKITELELGVKKVKDKEMTLELSGKTTGTPAKDYVLETLWSKE